MILLLISYLLPLRAAQHFARVEPWDRITIKASASGEVLEANRSLEGRSVQNALVIRIDDRLDRIDLDNTLKTLKLLTKSLELTKQMLPGLKESFKRQRDYFDRLSGLSSSSQNQKDQAYQAMVEARNRWLSTRQQIINLKQSILQTKQRVATLEDRISKKSIRLKNRYLYRLMVSRGEYVGIGTPLAIVDDLSRAKAVIYLSEDELKALPRLRLWINGKLSKIKPYKVWRETDDKYLSSYRAEIELPPERYPFSSLVKMELK